MRVEGDGPVREVIDAGGSVVAFLGHLGNWDLAGAWATSHLGAVTTVAERLKPEEVFEEFLAFRESLGMTIIPLTGGVNPFPALREASRRPGIIPLLADRDLTDRGVEVDYLPKLGKDKDALAAVIDQYDIAFHQQVPVPETGTTRERATAMTQACADALGTVITQHTSDWHMMQRVFIDDLDPARLPVAHGAA